MVDNYCSHCGAKLPKEAKFCQRCGREVGAVTKKRKYIGGRFLAISVILSLSGIFVLSLNPNPKAPEAAIAIIFFFLAGIFYLAALIEFFKWLFRKNKYVFGAVLALFILIPFFSIVYDQYQRAYISQTFEVQDAATEVAYAKSIGDDLIEGRTISEGSFFQEEGTIASVYAQEKITSMAQVQSKVKKEYERLKAKKVRPEVGSYKASIEAWTFSVLNASKLKKPTNPTYEEITRWRNLPQTPSVIFMSLESDKRAILLDSLVDRIKPLRNIGDTAITKEDKSQVRLIAARALMQSNFAESLSSKTANVCGRGGCISEVKTFISGVHRTAYNYMGGNQGAVQDWKTTWNDPPEIIKSGGTPLGGLGITQGTADPTPPPNPSTTIRNVTPFLWQKPQVAPWDGRYSASANISCDTESGDFGQSFADGAVGDFEVRGGKIIGGAVEIAIDDSGYANYNANVVGIEVTTNYYFVQTGGGVSVTGDMALFGSEEGATVSCTGDFTGSRISL